MRRYLLLVVIVMLVLSPYVQSGDPDPARIQHLIQQLGSDKFHEREAASKALEEIGEPTLELLQNATESEDAEIRRRVKTLMATIQARLTAQTVAMVKRLRGSVEDVFSDRGAKNGKSVTLSSTAVKDKDLAFLRYIPGLCYLDL